MTAPGTFQGSILDLLHPPQRFLCKCQDCGDVYQVTYRVGCFGPMGGEAVLLTGFTALSWKNRQPILCAHCGHEPWAAPPQALLRRAFRLERRLKKLMDDEVRHLVRNEGNHRLSLWAAQLRLDHFRQLAPAWFAALWEGGPNPNPKTSLPSNHEKMVRFFLHQVARPEPMQAWPLLPPADHSGIEACRERLRPYLDLAQRLAPGLKRLGTIQAMYGGGFVGSISAESRRPVSKPGRGNTDFCYHLEEVDGPQLGKDLIELARLDPVCETDLEAPRHVPKDPLLKDRLDMLLHQQGLARNKAKSETGPNESSPYPKRACVRSSDFHG